MQLGRELSSYEWRRSDLRHTHILQLPYPVTQIIFTLPLPQEECSLHAC